MIRPILIALALAGVSGFVPSAAQAQQARAFASCVGPTVPAGDGSGLMVEPNGKLCVTFGASNAFSVTQTASIGTTSVLVSAADPVNRRTIRNTSSIACEIDPSAGATYGAGHPLPAGESFTFDSAGRTTAALYVACASAGGSVSVIGY